jgi:hypothetical protein
MSENDELRQKLLDRIKDRRTSVKAFASSMERRGTRLTTLGIVCEAATAVLTAGPAFGGTKFTETVGGTLGLASNALVWQGLCLLAVVLSIGAAIISNMTRSTESYSRLTKAQASGVLLERLETALEFGQVPVDVAAKQFQEYLSELSYISEKNPRA